MACSRHLQYNIETGVSGWTEKCQSGAILDELCFCAFARDLAEVEPRTVTENTPDKAALPDLIDLPVRDVVAQVASTDYNSGGGVIAGTTLAGAAASAELVLRLAVRRKSLADHRQEIATLLDNVERHRHSFEGAADRDVAAFSELVATQREAKAVKPNDPEQAQSMLQRSYVRAAEAPLELSREALTFMQCIESGLEFASRFTISDLGAAAALARGAIEAALLTVDANLAYVEDEQAASLRQEVANIRRSAAEIAERVLERATKTITGETKGS